MIVTNPYRTPDSKCRKGLIVKGDWDVSIEAFIHENNIKALYLNSAKGWTGSDYSFLGRLNAIEELNIISSLGGELNAIEGMESLEELSVAMDTNSRIEFKRLSRLRKCFLDWWRNAETIFEHDKLEDLHLYGANLPSFDPIRKMQGLRFLNLSKANINNIEPITTTLPCLHRLELVDCKKISSFSSLALLAELRWLRIEGVRDLGPIDFVSPLGKLEVLQLCGVGEIPTLQPLEHLLELRAFAFPDNTTIADGDLTVLTQLPGLSMLMFAPKRHYSHKLMRPWSWENLHKPCSLLLKKVNRAGPTKAR